MTPSLSLNDRQLAAAIALLQREQRDYLPSRGEIARYRMFNVATALIVVLLIALNLAPQGPATAVIFWLLTTVALANVVLFVSNFGLIRKFWRMARVRKRLGLTSRLAPFLGQRQGPWDRVGKYLAGTVCIVTGLFCLGFFLFLFAPASRVALLDGQDLVSVARYGLIQLTLFFLVVGLLSAPLMWRGRKRLELVMGLEESLNRRDDKAAEPAEGETYRTVATNVLGDMERQQIIMERRRALQQSRKEKKGAGYALQVSMEVRRAKQALPPDEARAVEDCLQALALDGGPRDAPVDAESRMHTERVPGTPLQLLYKLDEGERSIRVFHLRSLAETEKEVASHG